MLLHIFGFFSVFLSNTLVGAIGLVSHMGLPAFFFFHSDDERMMSRQ